MPTRVDGFARPADLAEAFALLRDRPDATVLAGGTDWGVEVNLRGERAAYVVAVDRLPELGPSVSRQALARTTGMSRSALL